MVYRVELYVIIAGVRIIKQFTNFTQTRAQLPLPRHLLMLCAIIT